MKNYAHALIYTLSFLVISTLSIAQEIEDSMHTDYTEVVIIADQVQKTTVFSTFTSSRHGITFSAPAHVHTPIPSCIPFEHRGTKAIIIDSKYIRGKNIEPEHVALNFDINKADARISSSPMRISRLKKSIYALHRQDDIITNSSDKYYLSFSYKKLSDKAITLYTNPHTSSLYYSYQADINRFMLLDNNDNFNTIPEIKIFFKEVPTTMMD